MEKDFDIQDTPQKFKKLPILLYDQECELCKRFKLSVENIDREQLINFIPIQDEQVYFYFDQLDIKECYEKVHLIDQDNKIYQGKEVIEFLVNIFPQVSKFSWLLESNMGQKALDFFYDKVNEYRKKSLKKNCHKCNSKFL
jgi:predicted DCC family thiol-disulfide oxidoreductase YuxK